MSFLRPGRCASLFSRGVLVLSALALCFSSVAYAADFEVLVDGLAKGSFSKKRAQVDKILATKHERRTVVADALLEGLLYQEKATKRIVIAVKDGQQYALASASTGEPLGKVSKGAIKKIRTNNGLRKYIRTALALLDLSSDDPNKRIAAAEAVVAKGDPDAAGLLRDALSNEENNEVREQLALGLDVLALKSGDLAAKQAAIESLGQTISPVAIQALRGIADNPNDEAAPLASAALEEIEDKLALYGHVESLFFGISLGSVLLLAAIGLAVTFGVMGVINMAHGEMVMVGAYTTYVVQLLMPESIGYSLFVAIPAAFLVTACVGIAIERGVIQLLYGRPLETLLATFGISLILQQAVRTFFSPLNRSVSSPEFMSGVWEVNPALAITYNRLYIIAFSLAVVLGLYLLLKRTRFGLEVRAVTQNRAMARAMGIRTARVDALTFGLGSGIAGMAGVALSQITNVGPNMGQAYIVDSFMVVVFGGVGNLLGTFVGAMSLGIANKFLEPVIGAVVAKIAVLVFIILFIQRRPQGLFAMSGRAQT